ncbi:hypothetical protein L7F22_062717 [Adiantum nelumboides]|nr:hypothetical protein [Adiantum nelumboides]
MAQPMGCLHCHPCRIKPQFGLKRILIWNASVGLNNIFTRTHPNRSLYLPHFSQHGPLTPSCTEACFNHSWPEAYLNRESLHDSYRFLVYIEGREGLGNGLLSLPQHLHSLATYTVLLIDGRKNIAKLICKPFPESRWVLPRDFLYQNLQNHYPLHPLMVANRFNKSAASLNLQYNLHGQDELIFCEETYTALMGVKWVAWKSNQYSVTNFFHVPSFWQRLRPISGDDVEFIFTKMDLTVNVPLAIAQNHGANPSLLEVSTSIGEDEVSTSTGEDDIVSSQLPLCNVRSAKRLARVGVPTSKRQVLESLDGVKAVCGKVETTQLGTVQMLRSLTFSLESEGGAVWRLRDEVTMPMPRY